MLAHRCRGAGTHQAAIVTPLSGLSLVSLDAWHTLRVECHIQATSYRLTPTHVPPQDAPTEEGERGEVGGLTLSPLGPRSPSLPGSPCGDDISSKALVPWQGLAPRLISHTDLSTLESRRSLPSRESRTWLIHGHLQIQGRRRVMCLSQRHAEVIQDHRVPEGYGVRDTTWSFQGLR